MRSVVTAFCSKSSGLVGDVSGLPLAPLAEGMAVSSMNLPDASIAEPYHLPQDDSPVFTYAI